MFDCGPYGFRAGWWGRITSMRAFALRIVAYGHALSWRSEVEPLVSFSSSRMGLESDGVEIRTFEVVTTDFGLLPFGRSKTLRGGNFEVMLGWWWKFRTPSKSMTAGYSLFGRSKTPPRECCWPAPIGASQKSKMTRRCKGKPVTLEK